MHLYRVSFFSILFFFSICTFGQKWTNVDSLYQPLPPSVHIYFTQEPIDTAPFRAYYLIADLRDKQLEFTTDTSRNRRLTPNAFYERNDHPLAVVNCTFFSYETNAPINLVIKNGEMLASNLESIPGRGKDTFTYRHALGSAIGIDKKRNADIGWLFAPAGSKWPLLSPFPYNYKDSVVNMNIDSFNKTHLQKWKMRTATGGGPVLLQKGDIHITNNEELRFTGKAIKDKHPRTAMGYTKNGKLIILMVEGRNKVAHGATLTQEAQIFKDLGCWEAINLDGGGSSCLLLNGKETIRISDSAGQRPVPAVFIIRKK
jgi:hypothetical protein